MIGKVILSLAAAAVAVAITVTVVLGAGWLAEAFGRLAAIHAVAKFLRPVAFVVSPMMGMVGVFFALAAVWRHRNRAPEEPIKPRLRNGAI
jgi:hypothetical protein